KETEPTIDFPRAWLEEGSYDFSFSGLKSSVINYIHNTTQRGEPINAANIAASFQASVIDVLVEKTYQAAQEYEVKDVIVAGGVAANNGLRTALEKRFEQEKQTLHIPPIALCTDNAAMIAAAGSVLYEHNIFSSMHLNAHPSLPLSSILNSPL